MSDTPTRDDRRAWVLANRTHEEVTEDLLDREDEIDALHESGASSSGSLSSHKGLFGLGGAVAGLIIGWILGAYSHPILARVFTPDSWDQDATELVGLVFLLLIISLFVFAGYRAGLGIYNMVNDG